MAGDETEDETVIYIPKQLVIYIEQNRNIKDELRLRIIFPDKKEVKYIVPVMKYWEYGIKELLEKKLYPLLPLQVFKLRHKLEQLKRRKSGTEEHLKEAILEAKEAVRKVGAESRRLQQEGIISGEDLHSILKAANSLFNYLNSRYTNIDQLNKEVQTMIKSFYDPAVKEEGIEEGIEKGIEKGIVRVAKNMYLEGEDIEKIKRYTGLSEERIEEIRKNNTH